MPCCPPAAASSPGASGHWGGTSKRTTSQRTRPGTPAGFFGDFFPPVNIFYPYSAPPTRGIGRGPTPLGGGSRPKPSPRALKRSLDAVHSTGNANRKVSVSETFSDGKQYGSIRQPPLVFRKARIFLSCPGGGGVGHFFEALLDEYILL